MKCLIRKYYVFALLVAPVRERGLKCIAIKRLMLRQIVAPVRERGLKYICNNMFRTQAEGRSREGAWIEIKVTAPTVL